MSFGIWKKLKPYENPEWQADTFASEFLMDYDLIQEMDYRRISEACGVSFGVAKTRIGQLQRRKMRGAELFVIPNPLRSERRDKPFTASANSS